MATSDVIRKIDEGLNEALSAGDIDKYLSFFAEDAQLMIRNRPVLRGKDDLANFFQSAYDGGLRLITTETIDLIEGGPLVVQLASEVFTTKRADGSRVEGSPVKFLAVYRRRDDAQLEILVDVVVLDSPPAVE